MQGRGRRTRLRVVNLFRNNTSLLESYNFDVKTLVKKPKKYIFVQCVLWLP